MPYKCKRCHFTTIQKNDFRRHLNRKRTCKAIYENIDIETLKGELEGKGVKSKSFDTTVSQSTSNVHSDTSSDTSSETSKSSSNKYICEECGAMFKHKQSKYNHKK